MFLFTVYFTFLTCKGLVGFGISEPSLYQSFIGDFSRWDLVLTGEFQALSHYDSGMTVEEAIDLVNKYIMEIRSRLVVAPPNFVIKIVDKDGAREYAWRESVKDAAIASS
ncbi:Detected protein of unknown function [Hibiscus syriacus]|uniref:Uncharacterized protein n=1 Tax=Hibiscus syriacus TaxID=106335 RepID=A0A6A3C960_HIBSY|nr:Detected protein of unknown function [Hibiscus syriacus]